MSGWKDKDKYLIPREEINGFVKHVKSMFGKTVKRKDVLNPKTSRQEVVLTTKDGVARFALTNDMQHYRASSVTVLARRLAMSYNCGQRKFVSKQLSEYTVTHEIYTYPDHVLELALKAVKQVKPNVISINREVIDHVPEHYLYDTCDVSGCRLPGQCTTQVPDDVFNVKVSEQGQAIVCVLHMFDLSEGRELK